jgi:hypothetical protein
VSREKTLPLNNENERQASYPSEFRFGFLFQGCAVNRESLIYDLTACSNASEYSTIASRRSSSRRLFAALSSGEYWRSGRSMNARSFPSAVFMRSSALLRISSALRVGTGSSSLAYNVTGQFAFRFIHVLRRSPASWGSIPLLVAEPCRPLGCFCRPSRLIETTAFTGQ